MKEGAFWFYFDKEKLAKLIKIFGTNNKYELKQKIESKIFQEKPKQDIDFEIKKAKLQELQIKNRIKLIHELHLPPSVAIEVQKGNITLDETVKPSINREKIPETNGICDLCGHKHTETEPRVCLASTCNCGIRGY